ncbi:MAG TPA: enoyl-CoA hydratase-related protein [Myxococcota bacterium]|nr:enoyl-CoA hydratase-related protein [Myxococcota bacterium]
MSGTSDGVPRVLETAPERYRHWRLAVDGAVARLALAVDEAGALQDGVALKRNSYDLGVDLELRDAVTRLRIEHPEVRCVVLESALPDVFCAGANIAMLARSSHPLKVNFCKLTNETRLEIEDATRTGQRWIAALAGTASGGGYELALACERILLVDDRRAAVSLPELPLLAVLPGTGGLTRLVDKRGVRRDLADVFCTLEEGVRAPRALEWGLVDAIAVPSEFGALVEREVAAALAPVHASHGHPTHGSHGHPTRAPRAPRAAAGLLLEALDPEVTARRIGYRHIRVSLDPERRVAEIRLAVPEGSLVEMLRLARELDDALLRLRFHHTELGLWLLRVVGSPAAASQLDRELCADSWLAGEVRALWGRVLKRLENSARSSFALADAGACFVGPFLELALAADRSYLLRDADPPASLELTPANFGAYRMGNGLTRLETRFLGAPALLERARAASGALDAERALELGLVTEALDEIDWGDSLRVVIEERASFSPDALTGLEASLRFAGPETLETKIFARLSAWQNWIFQRPNAAGPDGALRAYGRPERAKFDWNRT